MFNNLKLAASQAKKIKEDSPIKSRYETVYKEGVEHLRKYSASPGFNQEEFFLAADKLAEAINLNKFKPEPYLYLAWLFFIANDSAKSLKYLRIAEAIKPDLAGIKQLRGQMSQLW
jgi:hypothetical protein